MVQPVRAFGQGRDLSLVVDLGRCKNCVAGIRLDQRVEIDRRGARPAEKPVNGALRRVRLADDLIQIIDAEGKPRCPVERLEGNGSGPTRVEDGVVGREWNPRCSSIRSAKKCWSFPPGARDC